MKVIEIDHHSTWLKEYIHGSTSEKDKLFQISYFLYRLRDAVDHNSAVSYFLEFYSWFIQYFTDDALAYSSPEQLQTLRSVIQIYSQIELQSDFVGELKHCRYLLLKHTAYTWLILGEWENALNILSEEDAGLLKKGFQDSRQDPPEDLFERLSEWVPRIQSSHPETARICQDILNRPASQISKFSPDMIHVLLTNQVHLQSISDTSYGTILPVHLVVKKRPGDAEEDIVKFNNEILHSKSNTAHVLQDVILAVRAIAEKRISRKLKYMHFTFHLSIPRKDAVFTGNSWDASLALLIYCGILNLYYNQKMASAGLDTLITGCLDISGRLLPVGKGALKDKITAAFFSHHSRLIVPVQQIGETANFLSELRQRYPKRHLSLEGAENLVQLLGDKNVFDRKTLTLRRRIIFWFKAMRERSQLIPILAGFFIVLMGVLYRFLARDISPVDYEIRGNHFVAKNLSERELWTYDFEDPANIRINSGMDGAQVNLKFSDLNGDRKNEVLLGTYAALPAWQGLVFCFSNNGSLLWKYKVGRPVEFGNTIYHDHYNIFGIYTETQKSEFGPVILVVAGHQPYFPSVHVLLSAQGQLLGEYWNSGRMNVSGFADLNGDSIHEIISCGINNETRGACLVVLDPSHMNGSSPQDSLSQYYSHELARGTELYYLRFPGSAFRFGKWGETVVRLNIYEDELFVVVGSDFMVDTPNISHTFSIVEYRLGYDLKLISCSPTDPYFSQYEKHFGKPPDAAQITKLGDIEYWNGKEWVLEAVPASH